MSSVERREKEERISQDNNAVDFPVLALITSCVQYIKFTITSLIRISFWKGRVINFYDYYIIAAQYFIEFEVDNGMRLEDVDKEIAKFPIRRFSNMFKNRMRDLTMVINVI
jgi:hypothetical protein